MTLVIFFDVEHIIVIHDCQDLCGIGNVILQENGRRSNSEDEII
jgi:hypothetical protein